MSAPLHTPGPWVVEMTIYEHMVAEVRCALPGSECGIAQVWSRDNGFADARLMAASPDLFSACNALLGLLQMVAGRDDIPAEARQALSKSHRIDEARAAIAKATGAA